MGSTWAKTVRVAYKGRQVSLNNFARVPWSRKDLDGAVHQGAKIKSLWQHQGLRDKVIISSMAGHSVIVKRAYFDSGPPKELEKTIYKEAGQYIPFDLSDVYLDYQVLGPGHEDGSVEVILVASKIKVVQDLMEVAEKSGLSLSIVDVDAFALSNCFEFNYPEFHDEPVYLLDIGGRQSIFSIFLKNQPIFFREMSFGGKHITNIIAELSNIGKAEAEVQKIQGPLTKDSDEYPDISRGIVTAVKDWTDEIKRLISFYHTSEPHMKQASKLFLSGGGSLLNGISTLLEQHLKIEVNYLDPWKNIQVSMNDYDMKYLDSVKPQFAVATGLALRGIT